VDEQNMKMTSARRRFAAGLVLSLMVCSCAGCSILNGAFRALSRQECVDDFLIGFRNSAMASRAWNRIRPRYKNHQHLNDFKAGFYDGYANVAGGGAGCCPAVAPSSYWSWKYQSPEGQLAVNAYFQGFPLGAKAAEQDGVGNWGAIPTNLRQPAQSKPFPTSPQPGTGSPGPVDAANPFLPEPIPLGDEAEEIGAPIDDSDLDRQPSDEAFERALEKALDADESVSHPAQELPLAGGQPDQPLVPRWGSPKSASAAEFGADGRESGIHKYLQAGPPQRSAASESEAEVAAVERVFGGPVSPKPATSQRNEDRSAPSSYSFR
jgi:hypothetical protein